MTPYELFQLEKYGNILPNYDNPFMLNEDEEKEDEERKFEQDEEIDLIEILN